MFTHPVAALKRATGRVRGRTSHRGNPTSLLEVSCVDWWMYLLMAAAAIVLLNVVLVVALVVFGRDREFTD